ncbi:hypothetical protein [Croceicoccus sp. Ery15]|uniref:hypothetical protein n=1 Tax=Croceicoccus sp. Ery15 TaxID=1703338 RepID=UPI001E2DC54D|nr:hypothetical protein [Croceicoccus sp. Ery15]
MDQPLHQLVIIELNKMRSGPGFSDRQRALYDFAIYIRDAYPLFTGREAMKIDNLVAHAIYTDLDAAPQVLHETAWHMLQSAIGLRNEIADARTDGSMSALRAATVAYVEKRQRGIDMEGEEAGRIINALVKQSAERHPRLGLSYGYIGNIWHAPYKDDRSFRVFTKVRAANAPNSSISFGAHSIENLGHLAIMAEKEFQEWCAHLQERLDAGELRAI